MMIWAKKSPHFREKYLVLSYLKVDKQGGKGVKQSAKGDETMEGWWWTSTTATIRAEEQEKDHSARQLKPDHNNNK